MGEKRAFVTDDPSEGVNWLFRNRSKNVAVVGFTTMFGLAGAIPWGLAALADVKGRPEGKPFFVTADRMQVGFLTQEVRKASPNLSREVVDIMERLLLAAPEDNPFGVIVPREKEVHPRLDGQMEVNGRTMGTLGLMVPGQDSFGHVRHFVDRLGRAVGVTSLNISGDKMSRGSGHHSLYGAWRHFGRKENVAFVVPEDPRHHVNTGPSTSVVLLDRELVAHIYRIGSLSKSKIQEIIQKSGARHGEDHPRMSIIQPYDYSNMGNELKAAESELLAILSSRKQFQLAN